VGSALAGLTEIVKNIITGQDIKSQHLKECNLLNMKINFAPHTEQTASVINSNLPIPLR
jgi:hypothetical protein